MTAVLDAPANRDPSAELLEELSGVSGRRRVKNAVMTALMGLSVAIIAVVLVFLR